MRISDWSSDVCSSDLLVSLDAPGPWYRLEYAHHLVGCLRHLVEIVAVEFDGHIATNAGDQFVEAQFDGLADFIKLPELAARNLFDLFDHIGFGLDARRPLILRLQDNERSEEHTSELQSLMRISY